MKEHPILFSGPLVRAILAGRKTQTRRLVKHHGELVPSDKSIVVDAYPNGTPGWFAEWPHKYGQRRALTCPFGAPGDRLWVRETWGAGGMIKPGDPASYAADWPDAETVRKWKPSIHMPRALSRIDLEVTAVRAERLRDITEEDAVAEGIERVSHGVYDGGGPAMGPSAQQAFMRLWDSINGERASWASNPWVWVVSFKVLRGAK